MEGTIVSSVITSMKSNRSQAFGSNIKKRDRYRCVVTGIVSGTARRLGCLLESQDILDSICILSKSYILLHSLKNSIVQCSAMEKWKVLYKCFSALDKFISDIISDPRNGFSLDPNLYSDFDAFQCSFIAISQTVNQYKWIPFPASNGYS